MIAIVEGVDGVGKTTLGRAIEDRFGIPLYVCERTPLGGKQPVGESQAEDRAAIAMAICTGADVTFDRSFPSEYVYGTALREGAFDAFDLTILDKKVGAIDHIAILLRFASPWDAQKRDNQWTVDGYEKLDGLYLEYVERSSMQWIVLDALEPLNNHVERFGLELAKRRPSMEQTYLELARVVSKRATCLARRNGAVLLDAEGHVVATGYNGSPKGCPHPETCERLRQGAESGHKLDLCNDVHAEENCVAQAGRTPGGTMFTIASPCHRCARMLINAGVKKIVYEKLYGDERVIKALQSARVETVRAGTIESLLADELAHRAMNRG